MAKEYKIEIKDASKIEVPSEIKNRQYADLIALMLDMGALDLDEDVFPLLKKGTAKWTGEPEKKLFKSSPIK